MIFLNYKIHIISYFINRIKLEITTVRILYEKIYYKYLLQILVDYFCVREKSETDQRILGICCIKVVSVSVKVVSAMQTKGFARPMPIRAAA